MNHRDENHNMAKHAFFGVRKTANPVQNARRKVGFREKEFATALMCMCTYLHMSGVSASTV